MSKAKSLSNQSTYVGKVFGGRIPDNLAKAIRIMCIEENKSVQELLVEALQDVLIKYGKKVPKD
jgi:hypothetical protein